MLYAARGLRRVFQSGTKEVRALDGLSLTVDAGTLVAVAGPSGCGKTTLLHVLGLLDAGFEGEVALEGQDVRALSAAARARLRMARIGLVFQSFHLLPSLDVRHNVALPHWKLHGDRKRALARADELLTELHLHERLTHDTTRLSGGEMQRVAIARALVNDPAVLLADEPTANLDAESTEAVVRLLQRAHARGAAVIVSSHDPEMIAHARRVIRLRYGRVVEDSGREMPPS
jgi:macrolide transport system ATP-binding/permease protein